MLNAPVIRVRYEQVLTGSDRQSGGQPKFSRFGARSAEIEFHPTVFRIKNLQVVENGVDNIQVSVRIEG